MLDKKALKDEKDSKDMEEDELVEVPKVVDSNSIKP